jgi:hypothetical protein
MSAPAAGATATIGPAEVVGAELRSSGNGFVIGNSQVPWRRYIIWLAAHGPVTPPGAGLHPTDVAQ